MNRPCRFPRALRAVLVPIVLLLLAPALADAQPAPAVQLVESWPVETSLDDPQIPDAYEVWLEMIRAAEHSLEFAEFYASNAPLSLRQERPESEARLEAVIQAIESAAGRGVEVRFLAEKRFQKTYPETLARLDAVDGIEVRIYDVAAVMGGILHAKYFLVDGREAFLGSQNFDWRALAHIQELGLRIRDEAMSGLLREVFEMDWSLAAGEEPEPPSSAALGELPPGVHPAFSPTGYLPREETWDLPQIVALLDGAESRIRVQLLSYHAIARDKSYWEVLENALRRAAARGVEVELLVAHWSKGGSSMPALRALQVNEHLTVRIATIPPWSGGCVPFGRVIHAKYCVVDGKRAWVGTSNWEKSYFHGSRNLGWILEDETIAAQLDRFFERIAYGKYTEILDPCTDYERAARDCE